MNYQHNLNLKGWLVQQSNQNLRGISERGALELYTRLSRDYEERTGATFYPDENVFSSTPEQFPQEVKRQLSGSVGNAEIEELAQIVGVGVAAPSGQSQRALGKLNYGSADGRQAGRYFMERTFQDGEAQLAMLQAIRGET